MSETDTTTVEIHRDTWRELNIRKEPGESFDSVIRRLIDATGIGVGAIKEDPDLEVTGLEQVDAPKGATCAHYDVVDRETCGDPAAYVQTMQYGDGDPDELYLCPTHAGEESDDE